MIHKLTSSDFSTILTIINDAAQAYKGLIPDDCWHEPYMSAESLKKDMDKGVEFYGYHEDGKLIGVMGLQEFPDVTLIRHAYVLTAHRNKGIGGKLLKFLLQKITKPVLIGTWKDTPWSIKFYEKHGFKVLGETDIKFLLKEYWDVSERHKQMSVVLADKKWFDRISDANYFC